MTRRRHDWQTRLDAYLRAAAATGFVWGETDCCMNAANAVRACTDFDPAAAFRGRYTTATGALRVLRRTLGRGAGGTGGLVEELAMKIAGEFGLTEIEPVYAQALDVAFVPGENGHGLDGIITFSDGTAFVVFTPEAGFTRMPFLYAARQPGARAWRV